MNAKEIFKTCIGDNEFVERLDKSVKNITRDGKLDQYDIPDIILIIVDILNNHTHIKFNASILGDLVYELITYIIEKYKLIRDPTKQETFNRLIRSSLQLLLLQPFPENCKCKCTIS